MPASWWTFLIILPEFGDKGTTPTHVSDKKSTFDTCIGGVPSSPVSGKTIMYFEFYSLLCYIGGTMEFADCGLHYALKL